MLRQLLAVDAGNSRLKFGLFTPSLSTFYRRIDGQLVKRVDVREPWPYCRRFLAIPAGDPVPWQTLADWQPEGVVIAGSNPQGVEQVLEQWHQSSLPSPLVIRSFDSIPIKIDVDSPEKVGLDRLLGGVAANALRPLDRSAIVIDSGTATTVNFVSQQGVFCGGAILPGLEMSAKALDHYTAALPLIPVQELAGDPPVAPGRNTRDAIRNGLFWGQIGAIRELVNQICRHQTLSEPDFSGMSNPANAPWLLLTGGGGPVLSSQLTGPLFIPSLGMHGLVLTAWQRDE